MRRAIALAAEAEGSVSPRPPVGAVVTSSGGAVVGEGYTRPGSGPHAEVVALEGAGERARGGTMHVTLEPCCFTGRTPPCTDALIASGVARVVVACRDPHPQVDGAGIRSLREAGVRVEVGQGRAAALRLIEPFTTHVRTGRPFVTLKAALTLDGKVAAPDRTSRWITGEAARLAAHELRRRCDAVLVGAGTVEADDPALTCRLDGIGDEHQPVRVIADSSGRTPPSAAVFAGPGRSVVLTTARTPAGRRDAWADAGAEVIILGPTQAGVAPAEALDALGEAGLCHLLVEGGPAIAASFVDSHHVDRFVLFLAPMLLGGDAPGMLSAGAKTLADATRLRIERVSRVGEDVRIDARPA